MELIIFNNQRNLRSKKGKGDYLGGAPGNAGKSSLDIWNSEVCSVGCLTIPTQTNIR